MGDDTGEADAPADGGSNAVSTTATPGRRKRRTQEERSTETRGLLLDATIECLAELGYGRTTAQEVANRAGLSRGAQLHHFGNKAQLVTAAMDHLFEKRTREFVEAFEARPPESDPVAAGIDLLWRVLLGNTGQAYMELVWAARTDEPLREAMIVLSKSMDERMEKTFSELFDASEEAGPYFDTAWTGLLCLLEGMVIERIVRPNDARLDDVLEALKRIAPMLFHAKA